MKVKHILISKDSKYYSGAVTKKGNKEDAECELLDRVECHAGKGLVGDRFYNYKEDFKGQITFISYELHQKLEKFLDKEIRIETYRRNIFVTEMDPIELVGKKFQVGGIEFEGVENCAPCKFMDKFIGDGALKWMRLNTSGGLRAKILTNGFLNIGDELKHSQISH